MHSKSRKLILCGLSVFSTVLLFAAGSVYSYEELNIYTAIKGDTLPKIALKFYNDPGKWETIRLANPYLAGSSVVMPGNQLIIPIEVEENRYNRPLTPGTSGQNAVQGGQSGNKFEEENIIAGEKWEFDGNITGEKNKKIIIGAGDTVFLSFRKSQNAKQQDKYTIYRKDKNVVQPKTGENMGTLVRKIGELEILTEIQNNTCTGKVSMAKEPILTGDIIKKQPH